MKKSSAKKNKLIINADDYGLSVFFNRGILELAKKKIVSSISVMIKRKFVNPADFKKLKGVSIGLHLELKETDSLKELEDQIRLFVKKFGKLPSHLDGHKHMHLAEKNIAKVARIAKKYNLPIRSYLSPRRTFIKNSGLKTPDRLICWSLNNTSSFLEALRNNKKRIIEIVCHPGYYDKRSKSSYNLQREKELFFLESAEFKKAIKDFLLINYSYFCQLK